ncbi:DUF6787 family protein [Aestuariibaculum sediminum]|uniref:DUF6787 domain-containing protein n=1 Tax=Aestuariibaculum sediminum TaxID=2770637 RepID=A0A8J6Q0U0_9FLAO|nr:DUF6787 family protein [Aestuariibaculum sediminum]MBD0832657.1 hypothetical protein [Aestuariibaculum sediminum]
MNTFKQRWQIQQNWQLVFPFLGVIILAYSAFKLSFIFIKEEHIIFNVLLSLVIYYLLLKFVLFTFKKLQNKWVVKYRWEFIRIYIVFALTGSSSLYISRPLIKLIGITQENLNPVLYWILFIFIGLIFYQILLVSFGWLFGQFEFFWNFAKKILIRFGLKRFLD